MKKLDFWFYFFVFLFTFIGVYFSYCAISEDYQFMVSQISTYQDILYFEYDRDFDSYEEYLVYRLQIGK